MSTGKSVSSKPAKERMLDFNGVMKIIRDHIITQKVPFMTWTELEKELRKKGIKNTDRFFGAVCDASTWGIDEKTGKREPWFEGAKLGELKTIKQYLYFPLKMIEAYEQGRQL